MNIRSQITILIAGVFVILGLAAIMVGQLVIMPSFAQLERADARTAMRRIDYALGQTLDQVAVAAVDWGNWADTYHFAEDHNPAFIRTNITGVALRQLNVNALMIIDRAGEVLLARDTDLRSELRWTWISPHCARCRRSPWREQPAGRPARGLLQTSRGILIPARRIDGTGGGPARGMVVMGRLLTPEVIKLIAAQAQADLTLLPPAGSAQPETIEETEQLTRVYRTFQDVYGKPIMTLRVDVPREVSLRGKAAVKIAALSLFTAVVVVLILLVVVLNRVILDPLAAITRHAVTIGEGKDLTTQLDLKRSDEMGVLAREFDRMVERVAESRMQLVDQSFQAGFAELAKGVLHNLGNAMTPIGVRPANLAERLRRAPAGDADLAWRNRRPERPMPRRRPEESCAWPPRSLPPRCAWPRRTSR